jgi:hypothetical protein
MFCFEINCIINEACMMMSVETLEVMGEGSIPTLHPHTVFRILCANAIFQFSVVIIELVACLHFLIQQQIIPLRRIKLQVVYFPFYGEDPNNKLSRGEICVANFRPPCDI